MSGRSDKEKRRQAAAAKRAATRRPWVIAAVVAAVVVVGVAATALVLVSRPSGDAAPPPPPSATATPAPGDLASLDSGATGEPVDGITCGTQEESLFHIHAHLAVFVDGQPVIIPAGIGIAPPRQTQQTSSVTFVSGGKCLYWLHSHTADGIIHVESPVQRTYTLGEYFDIWHQPLGPEVVGPAKGHVVAYVNGQPFPLPDPRAIPLAAHEVIQLDVGGDVPPQPYTFAAGQ